MTGLIVVADTTPLRYLVAIGCEHVLPSLYGRVLIPPAVAEDLDQESTPIVVRTWLAARPGWLEIREPTRALGPAVELDKGERQAIALAEEVAAGLLLVDDWDARIEAERRRLHVAGTLRVLADAATRGLIDLAASFERLRLTNFRVSSELLEALLEESGRSKPTDRPGRE
jgi:predicted nucleic acid-binding protein